MSYTCQDGGPHRMGANNKCIDCGRTNAEIDRLRERSEEVDFQERVIGILNAIEDRLIRIEQRQRGVCPKCGIVRPRRAVLTPADSGYKAWAKARREAGFDPESGHKLDCTEAA